jgi:simple sugar transport system permease protein
VIFTIAGTDAMVGVGETMLLISGELDLSVGTVFALAPFLMNTFYVVGVPIVIAFLMALLLMGVIGFANGYITAKIGVPALITTLGMFFLIRGLTLIVSNFHLITLPNIEPFRSVVGSGVIFETLPIPMVWAVGITIVVALMLQRTRHGLWTVATGSNPTGAGEVGVNTVRTKIYNFMLAAILAGLAGIIQAMRIGSAEPLQGGFDLTLGSIAAAAVGGTSLLGGSGTIIGTLIGSLLFGIFRDGLIIGGASEIVYEMALGIAVVLSVGLNVLLIGRRGRSGRQT